MRIDLLCSGSKGNSCLIRHEDTQLLIDCGSTKKYLMESFKKVGACVDDTNGVLISHAHSDHVSQLKHFKHLDVYSYCDLKDALDKHDVVPNQKLIIKDLSIQFLGLSHDSPHTIGFVVESDKEKLVYVTDTGYVPNQIKPYIANADHYIFESNHDIEMLMQTNRPVYIKQRIINDSGHLNNEDSARVLSEVIGERTREIVQAHISQEGNTRAQAYGVLEAELSRRGLLRSDLKLFPAEQFGIHLIAGKNNAS